MSKPPRAGASSRTMRARVRRTKYRTSVNQLLPCTDGRVSVAALAGRQRGGRRQPANHLARAVRNPLPGTGPALQARALEHAGRRLLRFGLAGFAAWPRGGPGRRRACIAGAVPRARRLFVQPLRAGLCQLGARKRLELRRTALSRLFWRTEPGAARVSLG